MGSYLAGQLCQDPFNLLLFFQLEFPQGIVGVHRGHWLHKIGGAGGGYVVHQAGDIILAFGFHRHHVTPLADGDDRLPQKFAVCRGRDHLLQAVPNLPGLDAHMAADIRQFRRSSIRDFLLGQDGGQDSFLQIFVWGQGMKQRIQHRLFLLRGDIVFYAAGAAQDPANNQQLLGLERASSVRPLQAGRYIGGAGEGRITLFRT